MAQMWISMGPQHPMTHGLWTLRVLVDGETIVEARPEMGYLHRGVEKIGERRRYFMNTTLADRLCYGSSMTWTYAYVKAVEELMEVEVPQRAEYIRVVMLELQRLASHLMWQAAFLPDLGLLTGLLYSMREREYCLRLMESLTGNRLLYNYMTIGGVRREMPAGWTENCEQSLRHIEVKLKEYEQFYDDSTIFRMRTQGVGFVPRAPGLNWGLTGPNIRGSGSNFDIRSHDPYSIYPELDFEPQVEKDGDCYARHLVRMREMYQSIYLIRHCLGKMPQGPIQADNVPLRADGEAFRRTEDSRGEALMYLVGDGSQRPYRWKIRSPMFVTVSAANHYLRGYKVADVPAIMGSMDMCIGETDK